ncbi:MAG: chloride channel protein [Prevotellaceae bacterium]|jgi:CIC family chloride channel protein|nr:chloride channel protein [Prevotellaceae bacterium]
MFRKSIPSTQLFVRTITSRVRRVNERQLLIVLSIVTGLLSGLAAVLLKHTVHFIQHVLVGFVDSFSWTRLLLFAFPAFGMLLAFLFVKYAVKDNISHGVTRVLYAISRKESKLPRHNTWTSIIASSITIGFGGSVGAEAPIVLTGSAIGSNIGQALKLSYKNITLLLACGAAGAIGGIFKAPLAGVIFTLEVLMIDITLTSIVPLLISAVAATSVSYLMLGNDLEFASSALQPFAMSNTPFYLILGVFCGLVGVYFTRGTMFIEGKFRKVKRPSAKWLIGGTILGLTIILFPPLYGEGYGILSALLNESSQDIFENTFFSQLTDLKWFIFVYLLLLLLFKVVAMSSTNGGGGVGGTFGPTLFMGGICGAFIGKLVNFFKVNNPVPEANFTMVGMAGLMAAVMHSPLTAIFLIAEITGGYTLFMPLMITAVTAFIVINTFEPHSIYTKRLAQRGDLLTQNKDQAVLTLLKLNGLIEKDLQPMVINDSLGDMVKVVAQSKRNVFPVVDLENHLMGILMLDDIRQEMFNTSKYDTIHVYDYMCSPPDVIDENEAMEAVLAKFEKTGAWNLPVVTKDNHYIGFVSKSKLLSAYRSMLVNYSG